MKVGILAYRQYPFISANTDIAYTIGDELSKSLELVYIGIKQDVVQDTVNDYHGIKIRYLNKKIQKKNNKWRNYFFKITGDNTRLYYLSKGLKKIVYEEKIDALICIIAPVDNALIAYYSKINIPIYLYQLDPFFDNLDVENAPMKKKFLTMLSRVSHLFTTDLLYQNYQKDSEICEFIGKISVLKFPKLNQNKYIRELSENVRKRLLYAGSLYRNIRNPEILIALKKCIPSDYQIIFCGSCDFPQDNKKLEDNGVICKGYCSQEQLCSEMIIADALINIGNLVQNQLGSKIIDYISTGKKIINITQIEKCPTIDVLHLYEDNITIPVNELNKNHEETQKTIANFLNKKQKKESWEVIQKNYLEYTPQFVSKQIIKTIYGG